MKSPCFKEKKWILNTTLALAVIFLASSCSTHNDRNYSLSGSHLFPTNYEKLVYKHTQKAYGYYGLDNVYQMQITFLNSQLQQAQIKIKKDIYKMDPKEYQKEQRASKKNQKHSLFFLNIYSPEKFLEKLSNKRTWRFYLYHDGKKQLGKLKNLYIKKYNKVLFYPNLPQGGKPFSLNFNIPSKNLESQPFHIKMIGPAGEKDFYFNKNSIK